MFEIWIASHIDKEQRLTYLISSLKLLSQYNIKVSISSDIKIDLPQNINHKIYKHDKQLMQFEHLKYLNNITKDKSLKILFLDDDDILYTEFLSSVEFLNNDAGIGFHCGNMDPDNLVELSLSEVDKLFKDIKLSTSDIEKYNNWYYIRRDFSGTWCILSIFDKFLDKLKINPVTDCLFTSYLSKNGYKRDMKCNIFRRKWTSCPFWITTIPFK